MSDGDYSGRNRGDGLSAAERIKRYSMRSAGLPTEGDMVSWGSGMGAVEYIMFDGVLGEYGGKYALEAQEDDPVALVRVFRNAAPTEFMVGKMLSELTVVKKFS